MAKLSFKRYSVEIEADYGTFIIPFDDAGFLPRYYDAVDKCGKYIESAKERLKETGNENPLSLLGLNLDVGKYFVEQIDYAFGEGTCAKVFGDITPTPDLIQDFLEAMAPYFEEYKNKRKEFTSKYSANRVGSTE